MRGRRSVAVDTQRRRLEGVPVLGGREQVRDLGSERLDLLIGGVVGPGGDVDGLQPQHDRADHDDRTDDPLDRVGLSAGSVAGHGYHTRTMS